MQMLGPTLRRGQYEAERVCWSYELEVAHAQHLHLGVPALAFQDFPKLTKLRASPKRAKETKTFHK